MTFIRGRKCAREGSESEGAFVVFSCLEKAFYKQEAVGSATHRTHCTAQATRSFAAQSWNVSCYRVLLNEEKLESSVVETVAELLSEALRNALEFREDLTTERLDRDRALLPGNPVFEK